MATLAIVVAGVLVAASLSRGGPSVTASVPHLPPSVRAVPIGDGALHLIDDRPVAPAAPPTLADIAAVVRSETGFGLALTSQLASQTPGHNVVDSPLSADLAISMVELGAKGPTEAGIAEALQASSLPASTQSQVWADLQADISAPGGTATVQLANSAWLQTGEQFVPSYLANLASSYGDNAYLSDFDHHNAAATAAINNWVSGHTAGKITQLFKPGSLDPGSLLVLANALNFVASWEQGVGMSDTTETFTPDGGPAVSIPGLANDSVGLELSTAVTAGYSAVEIPYAGGRYRAIVIEPPAGTMSGFVQSLDATKFNAILHSTAPELVKLTMPALNLSVIDSLNPALTKLGMSEAFSPAADLSGIVEPGAQIAQVQQAAKLSVNKLGTSFAAATGGYLDPTALRCCTPVVTINHPYLFLLQDAKTGVILADSLIANPVGS